MDSHLPCTVVRSLRPGRRSPAFPHRVAGLAAAVLAILVAASPAYAWTPQMQRILAREGARLAPNDLYRQIQKHTQELEEGALAPFEDGDPMRHVANPDGSGELEETLVQEVERAVAAIQGHLPFDQVVYQLGIVAHYVADANNPLNTSAADAQEARFFVDYLRYLESAEPRLPVIFYGLYPELDGQATVAPLIERTLRRGRELYPMVGSEYRRIGFQSGIGRFDDRSTAFGVASLAFSHAATDIGLVYRYIWLRSGGGDFRVQLPERGQKALRLPRLPRSGPLGLAGPVGGGGASEGAAGGVEASGGAPFGAAPEAPRAADSPRPAHGLRNGFGAGASW